MCQQRPPELSYQCCGYHLWYWMWGFHRASIDVVLATIDVYMCRCLVCFAEQLSTPAQLWVEALKCLGVYTTYPGTMGIKKILYCTFFVAWTVAMNIWPNSFFFSLCMCPKNDPLNCLIVAMDHLWYWMWQFHGASIDVVLAVLGWFELLAPLDVYIFLYLRVGVYLHVC